MSYGLTLSNPCRIDWNASIPPAIILPDLSLTVKFVIRGLCRLPSAAVSETLRLVDGRIATDLAALPPDITCEGDYRTITSWLGGETPVRDIATVIKVKGDLMLLGAVAAAFGLDRTRATRSRMLGASAKLDSLVQGHRHLADSLLSPLPRPHS